MEITYVALNATVSLMQGSPPWLSTIPPLLNLPTEILLLIASQLSSSPESLVALSLTCKALSSIRDTVKLCEKSRHHLLLLLQKDLGDRFFYCSVCCQLHYFSQQWSPTSAGYLMMTKISCLYYYCKKTFKPTPASYQYELNYIYRRLVMNRHFYSPLKGLPLESLIRPTFQETPSARIINNEQFLCITHTLAGGRVVQQPFQACHDVPGSCTRAEVREIVQSETYNHQVSIRPLVDGWSIIITVYHQLGWCREPEDWKWLTLTEYPANRHLSKDPAQPRRDIAIYPPGAIKDKWQTVEVSI
ncbi:hypothetical protein V8C37DRAFT_412493 [Trichoderma ceciliae]